MLDVNGGLVGQEVELLSWLVDLVQEVVDIPLCLDSADPQALMKALPFCKQRPMVNSISDEPARWAMLPVLKEHRPKVIALCLSESGMPTGVEDRVATASRLVDRLTAGSPEQVRDAAARLAVSSREIGKYQHNGAHTFTPNERAWITAWMEKFLPKSPVK